MKNLISKNTIYELPNLQYIFKVSDLYKYDMIYIYHHIHEGSKVTLVRNDLQIGGNNSYLVYFKNFLLGSLFISTLFTTQYGNLSKIEAEIMNITKEKYLPIKNLDVVISQAGLRLVS